MTHLIDTSVWHKFARYQAVQHVLFDLDENGAVFSTCPPIIAEYGFSARNPAELQTLHGYLAQFYQIDEKPLRSEVMRLQASLWEHGFLRGAGAIDTVIAAYAIAADHELVTCDLGHLRIAHSLKRSGSDTQLRVTHIAESGELTHA
jgi:predicted nucleic acid-binding protein